jgi:uncharacterized protein (TIGR03083 family)
MTGMEPSRYLECLAADYARLRTLAAVDPTADVPSCPGWSVADLVHHVGAVYLHKTLAIREGAEPEPWPPPELAGEPPTALLERAHDALLGELTTRRPEDRAGSWYTPDQTVGFWIRRMAHETVIHRMDAELGTRRPVTPVPADLAIDGIDELLKVFVAFGVLEWGEYFTDVLSGPADLTYVVRTDGAAWRVHTGPGRFTVEDAGAGASVDDADVLVSGSPTAVLRWVWNRDAGDGQAVTVDGPEQAVALLRRCITVATQ